MSQHQNRAEQLFIAPAQRQAWLRMEYAATYPEIPAGIWVTAFSAAWAVVGGVLAGARLWSSPGSRVLGDGHFIFRGGFGRAPGWTGPGSRADDP
jgi:hypothetical protein